MDDGFSFDSAITCSALFRVLWVNLGYIARDRCQNLKPKFAQVPEESEITYGAYLVAAGHLDSALCAHVIRRLSFQSSKRRNSESKLAHAHEQSEFIQCFIRNCSAPLRVPCSYK